MIQLNNLHKYYNKGKQNEIHVINGTTLSLPERGFVCILGESGSGKTTLLNTMGGLDDFKQGSLSIAGETLQHYSSSKIDKIRTKHCAYIFQNYYLLQEHTVEYNIHLALDMYTLSEEEKQSRIDYVLQAVDMQKYKKRVVSRLSGGQQQRIAIARALVKAPEIIFADEPTGNLDEANTMRVMQILKKVSETCLVVMVTHEKRLASFFADRIIHITNGRVDSDTVCETTGTCSYTKDATFYLHEYEERTIKSDNIHIHCYTNENDLPPLTLRLIYDNGSYYLKADNATNITFLTDANDRQLLFEQRPVLSEEEVEQFDYALEQLSSTKLPSLSLKEIFRLAWQNLKLLGKQQFFLVVSFLVMAVLLVLTIADIMTLNSIDIRTAIHNDSHYLTVNVEKNKGAENLIYQQYFDTMLDTLLEHVSANDIQFDFSTDLSYVYDHFTQIKDVSGLLTGYCFAPLSRLDESTLVYGRMPSAVNEIVIDLRVLENFLSQDTILAQLIPNPQYFIGKQLTVAKKDWTITVTGICDSGEPDIYLDKFTRLSLSSWVSQRTAGLSSLQQAIPNEYTDITLAENEALVSESFLEQLRVSGHPEYFSTSLSKQYKVVGTFPDDFPAEVVLAEEGYDEFLLHLIRQAKKFLLYTENKEAARNYFTNMDDTIHEYLQFFITDPFAEELAVYEEARAIKLDARLVITITIFFVSLVVLYFSMKSNAVKNIQNIAVYRLLGIKKRSIALVFALETAFLTSYTSLPAILLTSAVLKFIASIPSLEMTLVYPWSAVFGIVAFLYVINCLAGILPIVGILKLPPAKLAAKYDL